MLELLFEFSTEDSSRSLRLRAVGTGNAGDGRELLAVEAKRFGNRKPEGTFLFLLKVILYKSLASSLVTGI